MTSPATDLPAFRMVDQRYDDAIALDAISEHPDNANEGALGVIEEAMAELGFYGGILVQQSTGHILVGNHRTRTARAAGATHLPGWWYTGSDEEARKILAVDNRSNRLGKDNRAKLLALLRPMATLRGSGYSERDMLALLQGRAPGSGDAPSLADRFLVPPFDVLDARQGWWRARKAQWLALGIQSEVGRLGDDRDRSLQSARADPHYYDLKAAAEIRAGHPLTTAEFVADWYEQPTEGHATGTSIFDPVLCELVYRWWCPPGGQVCDPFAGGSVRGLVAAMLGRDYEGVDLALAQVQANEAQRADFAAQGLLAAAPCWHCADSAQWQWQDGWADLLFTCPPYYDLEQYSDDPADLSAMRRAEFDKAYTAILGRAAASLKLHRFAVVVVGDVRGPDGALRDLRGVTIRAMERAGLALASSAVLLTPVGSVRIAAGRVMEATRTLGRTHQQVLVFCKGDRGRAAEACGPVEIAMPADLDGAQTAAQAAAKTAPATPSDAAAPTWAKGYPLAGLRAAKALWTAHDGTLPMGAFLAVKEATVAEWAAKGHLHAWGRGGQVAAAAVVSHAKVAVRDYRGQVIARPQPGDWQVQRFAGDVGVLAAELRQYLPRLWMQLWMEHPADRWLAAELGLTWAGTKIRASSELVGVYGPEGTPPTGLDAHGLVRMQVPYDPAALWAEVQAAAPHWESHYATYNKRGTWQAVSLRGYGGDPGFIAKPAEMSRAWKAAHPTEMAWGITDTPLYDTLPQVRAAIDAIPGVKHRVRLMRLAPGDGELTRHSDITDPDAGTAPGQLLRLHLPLVTNPRVRFVSWTPAGDMQTANMATGSCWYLDTRKPHTAANRGPTERIHVVADVESCDALLALAGEPADTQVLDLAYTAPSGGPWQPWALTGEEHNHDHPTRRRTAGPWDGR